MPWIGANTAPPLGQKCHEWCVGEVPLSKEVGGMGDGVGFSAPLRLQRKPLEINRISLTYLERLIPVFRRVKRIFIRFNFIVSY